MFDYTICYILFSPRFPHLQAAAVTGFCLLPANLLHLNQAREAVLLRFAEDRLPHPGTFSQELRRWKTFWERNDDRPTTITTTLFQTNPIMFPNIYAFLQFLLIIPVTVASVERANSAFKFIKTDRRSTMTNPRMNALLALFVHKDIKLNYDIIVTKFSNKCQRRMQLSDPLL